MEEKKHKRSTTSASVETLIVQACSIQTLRVEQSEDDLWPQVVVPRVVLNDGDEGSVKLWCWLWSWMAGWLLLEYCMGVLCFYGLYLEVCICRQSRLMSAWHGMRWYLLCTARKHQNG